MFSTSDLLKDGSPLKSLFGGLFGWLGDFFAIFIADKAAGAGGAEKRVDRTAAIVETARKLAEAEQFNRAEFLMELDIIHGDTGEVQPIINLFHEFWKKKGVIWVGRGKKRRTYRENLVGHLLQQIPVAQRQTTYVRLSRLLDKDPEKFFAKLEVLHNDNLFQIERQLRMEFENTDLGKAAKHLEKELGEIGVSLSGLTTKPKGSTTAGPIEELEAWSRKYAGI